MINGEGARANTSPDRFDQKQQVSNDSSLDYSSCEESEFERYCSANSVMGTPSLCSSVGTCNDFLDLDFGSGKNLGGVGEDGFRERLARVSGDRRSVSTSGGFDYLRDGRRIEFHNKDANENGLDPQESSGVKSSLHMSEGLKLSRVQRGASESAMGVTECEDNFSENDHNSFDPFDFKESGSPGEEETLSRYEHSDDDGSMFNYGSDDDQPKMDLYNMRNLQYLQNSKTKNENPLVVGSAVAFGSDDWDDFIQETEYNSFSSLSLNKHNAKQQQNVETSVNFANSTSVGAVTAPNTARSEQAEMVRVVPAATFLSNGEEDPERFSTRDSLPQEKDFLVEKASLKMGLTSTNNAAERELQRIFNDEVIGSDVSYASENDFLVKSKQSDSLFDTTVVQCSSSAATVSCGKDRVHFDDSEVHEAQPAIEDEFSTHVKTKEFFSSASVNRSVEHLPPIKVGNYELKDSYDDVVLDMEEILLDSMETHGARFPQSNRSPLPFRDGSSTASTSGTEEAHPLIQQPLRFDKVEVVGAKQKKGDVSLGERLVGVKEYTVYLLRVWSGTDQWEVERRYRDFFTLYRQLKTLYANHGWSLPRPWSRVEQESRKLFGNSSPNVVSERSALIQECLLSILHTGTPNIAPGTLNWFLSPQKDMSSSSLLSTVDTQSTSAFMGGTFTENVSTFGKTISLLVDIQPCKSVKQLLEAQHYVCAGCHKRLDAEKSLMREFVHTLGWGKPRLCEYTGQVFCASCHTNETAVLPARVLHFWDFTPYPVSQMAKSYLDSIFDQPMLCVSAVNPFLFSKVPALFQVTAIRKKIGAMMPYVRCPFRRSIQKGVGSRRYLLESNEFFALRDLVDLSKGAFAALPVMVETLSTKILDHIMQRCLVCCDVGIPCGARQACEDPSSLIFPFQEDEVKRCKSCKTVFHKPCFRNLSNCPCGAGSKLGKDAGPAQAVNHGSSNDCNEALETMVRKPDSGSPVKFLSHLFSQKSQEKVLGRKNSNPVILMGSLPSTFSDPL